MVRICRKRDAKRTAGDGGGMSDTDLMRKNLKAIDDGDCLALRVSAEHYAWLAGHHGILLAIVNAAGGEVEGHPTSLLNVLKRVRLMAMKEKGLL